MSTRDIDRGLNRIRKELAAMNGSAVRIGVFAGDSTPEGQTIAEYAAHNEYGTDNAPSRSFMRSTFDENQDSLNRQVASLYRAVIDGKVEKSKGLALIGQRHEAQIKTKITTLQDPPNRPSTIERKGSSNPLIDKGDSGGLRGAIRYEVV